MTTSTITPDPIFQMINGFQVSGILRSAIELKVFDQLADGGADAVGVATAVGADARGVRILLDALAALGLVENGVGRYRNSVLANTFLVSRQPTFIGGLARVFASDWEWEAFGRLTDAVRHGGTVMERHGETPHHPWWGEFAANIPGYAGPASEALANILAPWAATRRPLHVLDVACGNGFYGLRIAQQQPHVRVWEADWPHVLKVARENAARFGVQDRANFIEGDIFTAPFGGPYDLAIVSQILHHFSEQRGNELLKRVAGALKPDGRIAIQEFIPVGAPVENPMPRLFSVMMLVWTREGEAPSLPQLTRMLDGAGFGAPTMQDVPGMPSKILVADRIVR